VSWNIGSISFGRALLVAVEVRNVKVSPMLDDWDERDDVVAAGSICPVPDCGALVVSYRPTRTHGTRQCQIVV
jgi:hypothetical protein